MHKKKEAQARMPVSGERRGGDRISRGHAPERNVELTNAEEARK
jgi:hypothetical protein